MNIQNGKYEVLSIVTVRISGKIKTVKKWIRGVHPELNGVIVKGYTGWETIMQQDVIIPSWKYFVE